jgi:hypothetical protein
MGVLGAPLYPGGAIKSIYKYVVRLSTIKMGGLPVLIVGSYCAYYEEFQYKAAPIRFFKFVWGLPAGTEDPKNEVPKFSR